MKTGETVSTWLRFFLLWKMYKKSKIIAIDLL